MHKLTLTRPVERGELNIQPGDYVLDDVMAAQLLVISGGGRMEEWKQTRTISNQFENIMVTQTDGPKHARAVPLTSVLFMRSGGFGDLTLLTPVLRHLKKLHPSVHIAVCTMKHYSQALEHLPYVDEIVEHPILAADLDKYDAWVFYENAIENNPRAEKVHMTELFAEIAGIPMDGADLKPEYVIKPSELMWVGELFPRNGQQPRVSIQMQAAAGCRTYPPQLMRQVVDELTRRGWEVLMFDDGHMRRYEDQKLQKYRLTFRQSAALLNTSDVVIGPDSSLVHIAGALGVPCVALYGPFPWKLRTAHSPSITALQGALTCSPCFHHVNGALGNHFPPQCPTKDKGFCGALAEIEPKRIVSKTESVARKYQPEGVVMR